MQNNRIVAESYQKLIRRDERIRKTVGITGFFGFFELFPLDNDQNSAPHPLIVLLCDAFLAVFRDTSDVDFVLACSSASSKDFMWFADRRDINEYYNHAVDYEKMTFLNFNVQVTGFRIVLPQDNVNDEQII